MQIHVIRFSAAILLCFGSFTFAGGQDLTTKQQQIRAALDRDDASAALATLRSLRKSDPNVYALNNYDYLVGRLSEKRGDQGAAAANYLEVVKRSSQLRAYALWRLAHLARLSGDLVRERESLRQLL